jgi:hypothetical protein
MGLKDFFKPDEKNIERIISAVEKLGPQGLKVKADEPRSLAGLSNPEEGDEVIGGRAAAPKGGYEPEGEGELNAAQNMDTDGLDALVDEEDYIPVSDEITEVIEKAADASTGFDSFRRELEKPARNWPPDKIAECIAVAAFKARALGAAEFDNE